MFKKWSTRCSKNLQPDARSQVLVFTHAPEPELENADLGETSEKSKEKMTNNKEDFENMLDKRRDKANKLESRAAIHFVSKPLRLGPNESLFAEVSSSMFSTSSVTSSLLPGTNPFSALCLDFDQSVEKGEAEVR